MNASGSPLEFDPVGIGILKMKRHPQYYGLSDDIVLEVLVAAPCVVILAQDAIAYTDTGFFAHIDSDCGKQVPGKIRTGAETSDVSLKAEV